MACITPRGRVPRALRGRAVLLGGVTVFVLFVAPLVGRAQEMPELTRAVNDFANVIDPVSERALESRIRALQAATGDVVVVATIDTFKPYADIREYAVEMFENRGRGIGQRGKDNGALVLLAVNDREVWTEVGYDLEEFIPDGFAGETAREFMVPEFRRGNYGTGLLAGVSRYVSRIADRRNVTLQDVPPPPRTPASAPRVGSGGTLLLALFVVFMVINAIAGRLGHGRRRMRRGRWGGIGPGWHSGVGPFGGGFGGGFGGSGGFGGGFGGFGGGRSGGGGGGAGW